MFVGVSQEDVDGSEGALEREAATGTQEECNLLSIFWPLKQCLTVDVGFFPAREAAFIGTDV